ncbi:hypothetical protein [Aestuariirhabdus haliotis]|uniref:hypothetical protein n=1 Tax=Aestuariirhabdus haliotis TaxID=2918751 RepID=UPI0020C06D49|nr:hypothetical protein [Aestuariirhabdus haliotis]MCL6418121.1 hypothetical protein [Aestuariirhabdus haliotis]
MKLMFSLLLFAVSISVSAKEINISDTNISFVAPDEFQPLSQEMIDIKWPQKNAPEWVVGNSTASTTIAYGLKNNDNSDADLSELMTYFKTTFDRMVPGIEWIKRDIIQLSGKRWLYLEMTSNAVNADIHNIMLLTSYGEEMLIFNFNSTKDDFPKYETRLRESIQTIQLPN